MLHPPRLTLVFFLDLLAESSFKFTGASEKPKRIAPLPASDSGESPYSFVAISLAVTSVPQGKLNGLARNIDTGI
jgi:hypothetical protein